MLLATYSDLKSAIASWLNRDDLTDAIPNFITFAEVQFSRRLTHHNTVGRSDAPVAAADEYIALPTDFLTALQLVLKTSPIVKLKYTSPSSIDGLKSDNRIKGAPAYYTIVGPQIQLFPAADKAYTMEFTYRKRVASLSDNMATNWVLSHFPDVYLYGALVQAAPYLRDDSRTTIWGELFLQAIADCNSVSPPPPEDRSLATEFPVHRCSGWDVQTDGWS